MEYKNGLCRETGMQGLGSMVSCAHCWVAMGGQGPSKGLLGMQVSSCGRQQNMNRLGLICGPRNVYVVSNLLELAM